MMLLLLLLMLDAFHVNMCSPFLGKCGHDVYFCIGFSRQTDLHSNVQFMCFVCSTHKPLCVVSRYDVSCHTYIYIFSVKLWLSKFTLQIGQTLSQFFTNHPQCRFGLYGFFTQSKLVRALTHCPNWIICGYF
ncbi:hypothetical protein HELRODRAFT_159120 [Helobdella robusta]|uniref:Secreted protein n=1 Tax=Helobdella robusta TaxID=6412 RepID=T1ENM4_HELRO|nr:hypothetical protein HELRODRAFT_159120 [Helobdella robusta]ESO12562.1 hypothetical protein HELRODRAFT_159120 [Helobdella robusta]